MKIHTNPIIQNPIIQNPIQVKSEPISSPCMIDMEPENGNEQVCPPSKQYTSTIVGPESMRMIKEQCPTAVVATQNGPVRVPVPVGSPLPFVDVGTTSASTTTIQRQTIVANAGYNPYDPILRFSQYFPTPPLPYICPVRIPSNEPKPTSVCLPISHFPGSTS
jgi:hypothetical protein